MSPALELKDVTVSYSDGDSQVKALDSVNLSINPGEFVAVAGPQVPVSPRCSLLRAH